MAKQTLGFRVSLRAIHITATKHTGYSYWTTQVLTTGEAAGPQSRWGKSHGQQGWDGQPWETRTWQTPQQQGQWSSNPAVSKLISYSDKQPSACPTKHSAWPQQKWKWGVHTANTHRKPFSIEHWLWISICTRDWFHNLINSSVSLGTFSSIFHVARRLSQLLLHRGKRTDLLIM